VRVIEVSQQAETDWVDTIHRTAMQNQKFQAECTPGYYNNEGQPGPAEGFLAGQYGGGPVEFFQILADWRAEGKLAGLELG
jgi:cyclohexanone monooxygenase